MIIELEFPKRRKFCLEHDGSISMVDWQFHTVPGWLVGRAHMERAVSYGTNTFESLSNALESEESIVLI